MIVQCDTVWTLYTVLHKIYDCYSTVFFISQAGHVYICDMKIMDGLKTRDGCFASAPICLLYVNSSNQLVPIAIQLKQGTRDEEKLEPNPIFLPSDHWIDWLLAKIYYQAAHAQVIIAITSYFLKTPFTLERKIHNHRNIS